MSTTDSSPIVQASSISQPAKCKLCGAVIGHFALTWPDPGGPSGSFNQQEFARLGQAVAQHMQKRAQQHVELAGRSGKPLAPDKHAQALAHAANLGGNLTQAFLWRHFSLPEAAEGFQEQIRSGINHMTSKFHLTDAMAEQLAVAMLHNLNAQHLHLENSEGAVAEIKASLLTLASRYEEGHPTEPASKVH